MARRYDQAAGAVLVTEAGGKVTDTHGDHIYWRGTKPVHMVTTNGRIHTELLSILNVPHQ